MRHRVATLVVLTLAIASVAYLLAAHRVGVLLGPDELRIREWVAGWGSWAPLAIVLLQAGQVLLAPIPGQVLGLVGGYVFGTFWGSFLSLSGTAVGSLLAVTLARRLGRPLVERLVPAKTLAVVDAGVRKQGMFFLLLVFLLPFLPDDLACFAAGLTPIPIPALMLAAVAGRLPGIWVSCWVGAHAVGLSLAQWVALALASAAIATLFLLYGEDLQTWMLRWAERLSVR